MPVVSIVELGRESADRSADETPCNRIFSVTNHTAKHGSRQQRFEIPSTPLELMDDIRWYLEDFALLCPLETKRADRVKHSLKAVGRALVNSIEWASIVGPEERKESLILSIQEQPCGSAPVVWELLEDSEVWDDPFKGGVFVSRHVQKPEGTPTAATHGKRPETASASLNILIVAARPRGERDIPHRIVSKILYDKIRRQSHQLTSPTYLKILRPPTWEEFNRELETKGVGFYDIVHFDVHGVKMDDNRQGLAFVETATDRTREDKRRKVSTSDLASVLALHGVRRVVLNACSSAQYQDADQSIALGILKAGVEECVAMTFDVASRAVEIFMSIFYDAILTKGLARFPFGAAAAWARQALRLKPDRHSRYATSVSVYDYMIPVCYTNAFPRDSDAYSFTGRSLQFARRPPFNDVVGREADIFSIETRLLVSAKGLWLCGRPGVGKTALLRHLSAWWRETGLATGVYLHDCRAPGTPASRVEGFWRGAHNLFLPAADYQGPDAVIGYLRQNQCIVMLDNASPERPCIRFVSQILKKLDLRSTKVIFATRSVERWENVSEFFEPTCEDLGGLSKLGSLQLLRAYMENAIQNMTGQAAKSVGESSDDLHCFEQIAMLLDGNPAAFRVVVAAFLHSRANTMKEFLSFLIVGAPLMESQAAQRHLMSMGQTEDLPCVAELLGIVQSLATPPPGKYAVPVEVLAPFWELLPRSDLPLFVAAYSDQVSKDLAGDSTLEERIDMLKALMEQDGSGTFDSLRPHVPSGFKAVAAEAINQPDPFISSREFKELFTTMINNYPRPSAGRKGGERSQFLLKDGPDYADFVKQSPVSSIFAAACARIVDPLRAAHFLSVDGREPRGHSKTDYYRIHPLLPLLLRASPLYNFDDMDGPGIKTVHIKKALVFYYAYRVRAWPFEHQYFAPQWQGVREELELEFLNFVSASAMYSDIQKDAPAMTLETLIPTNMVVVLHRGVGTEISRFQLAHVAQEKAMAFVLCQEKRISGSAVANAESNQMLFLLRMYGAVLAGLRGSFVSSPTSEENKPFAALCGTLHQRVQQMGNQFLEGMWAKVEMTPATIRYHDWVMSNYASASPGMIPDETRSDIWKLRQGFMKDSAAITGETSYTSHKSWSDIPTHAISGGKHRVEMISALQRARDAMDRGQLDQARQIVDEAWEREVFHRNGDRHYKAHLLELRAEICERDGDWESGAAHRSEARQMVASDASGALGAPAQESPIASFLSRVLLIAAACALALTSLA